MTTKTFDSTISEPLQHNLTDEYVSPEENPIALPPEAVIKVDD